MLAAGKQVVSRSTTRYGVELYRARHAIESFFARLKQWRTIATGYAKTARNFLGAIYLVAASIWMV